MDLNKHELYFYGLIFPLRYDPRFFESKMHSDPQNKPFYGFF